MISSVWRIGMFGALEVQFKRGDVRLYLNQRIALFDYCFRSISGCRSPETRDAKNECGLVSAVRTNSVARGTECRMFWRKGRTNDVRLGRCKTRRPRYKAWFLRRS